MYCLIEVFKLLSYLDNGKIHIADQRRLIGSFTFSFFLCNRHDFFVSLETTDENATTKKKFSNFWICHIVV